MFSQPNLFHFSPVQALFLCTSNNRLPSVYENTNGFSDMSHNSKEMLMDMIQFYFCTWPTNATY